MGRPTKAEREQIEAVVRELLEQRKKNGQIKRAVALQFDISPRTVERYLRRAREAIVSDTERPASEHRADAHVFYLRMLANPDTSSRDKLRAQDSIVDLLGLKQPAQKAAPKAGLDLTLDQLKNLSDVELQQAIDKLHKACKPD